MNITVQTKSFDAATGFLMIGAKRFDCTLGKNGVTLDKTEGDGKTPVGTYPLRQLIYRADRLPQPETGLPAEILTPETGWCEDPLHPDYNRKVSAPHAAMSDRMTRDDHLYDMVVVIGYNDDPPVAGKGSAIFMHLARPDFTGTAGCIGLKEQDLLEVLALCSTRSHITILPPPDDKPADKTGP